MAAPTRSSEAHAQPWLRSPLRTAAGDLQLAGLLDNVAGIDPAAMRVLGSYALVLMVEGQGYYRDGRGTQRELGPGDVVMVFPDIAHAYGPRSGRDWTQVYYVFAGAQFDLWRRAGLLHPDRPVWSVGAPEYWRQRLAAVLKGEPLEGPGAALRAFGRFLDVLTEMIATDREGAREPVREAWVETSLRLLGYRTADGWLTPQEVARRVGLNYENFRKRFAGITGESPGHYRKRRRLDWACAAIYQGGHTIKQIADELGFCDVFHFSKAFKQIVGTTPSEYRRRVRGR
jgi:AraC-like DNA-binding protein